MGLNINMLTGVVAGGIPSENRLIIFRETVSGLLVSAQSDKSILHLKKIKGRLQLLDLFMKVVTRLLM